MCYLLTYLLTYVLTDFLFITVYFSVKYRGRSGGSSLNQGAICKGGSGEVSWSVALSVLPTGLKISIPAWDAILPPTAWKLKSPPPTAWKLESPSQFYVYLILFSSIIIKTDRDRWKFFQLHTSNLLATLYRWPNNWNCACGKIQSTSHCSLPLFWSFLPTASSEGIPGWDTFFPPPPHCFFWTTSPPLVSKTNSTLASIWRVIGLFRLL